MFDFKAPKFNDPDAARTNQALKGIAGKRLTYLPINAE